MRPITHCDVAAAARAIWNLPPETRRSEVMCLLNRAHAADLFHKRTGRVHPFWGNGSLSGAIVTKAAPAPEPFLSDNSYLEPLATVFETLLDWRQRSG